MLERKPPPNSQTLCFTVQQQAQAADACSRMTCRQNTDHWACESSQEPPNALEQLRRVPGRFRLHEAVLFIFLHVPRTRGLTIRAHHMVETPLHNSVYPPFSSDASLFRRS
mmetsp:Transcript_110367/g.276317  ORF Transcript_110367/g.276317 Transcript_110367/m.276317 type:complete len:111 (-) Transcript_110367:17-349(-)